MRNRLRDDVERLARHRGSACLSIYLPSGGRPPEPRPAEQLDHLVAESAQLLQDLGCDEASRGAVLEPIRDLANDWSLWGAARGGLAIFGAPGLLRTYRLPYGVAAQVRAGHRFHLKALLPLLSYDAPFYVLALSKNHVRLLRGAWDGVEQVDLPGAPASLADTLKYDEFEPQRQVHPGGHGAVFYGRGAVADTAKEELQRYCQQIDRAVRAALHGERAPLVLAGVGYLLAIYRAASGYPAILSETLDGSPDHSSAEDLRAQAWPLVAPLLGGQPEAAVARYHAIAAASPRRVVNRLRAAVQAAAAGRVETLFVAGDRQEWGTYDEVTGVLAQHSAARRGDEDLLDGAAVRTFLHGGSVYVLPAGQVPGGESVAAILHTAAG